MTLDIRSTIMLANGVEMPRLGLGTYKSVEPAEVRASVLTALETGYRSIDTASLYDNETAIGDALQESGIARGEVFLTSKVWNDEQGYDGTFAAAERSLARLGTSYLDLYLVHWPIERLLEPTWRAMEALLADGRVRAIGVCNFMRHHLDALLRVAEVPPMVDQYEMHPWLQQPGLRAFCQTNGIVVEAWAPIMRGKVSEVPLLVLLAEKYRVSPARVALRWLLQHDVVVIPKSVHEERVRENAALYDFELTAAEMDAIDALDRSERLGRDPDVMAWSA